MSLTGGATGQVIYYDKELWAVQNAVDDIKGYVPEPDKPFDEIDLESGEFLQLLFDSGLRDYDKYISGGNLTDLARRGLRIMSKNPHYQRNQEDGKAYEVMAESDPNKRSSPSKLLHLLTPSRLAIMIAAINESKLQGARR